MEDFILFYSCYFSYKLYVPLFVVYCSLSLIPCKLPIFSSERVLTVVCSLLLNSFFFLFLENYGVRKLEAAFAVLISVMGLSFAWMFADARPNREELLMGKFHLMLWLKYHFFI